MNKHFSKGRTINILNKFMSLSLVLLMLVSIVPFGAVGALADDVSVWDGSVAPFEEGSGTEDDPYLINSAAELAFLANSVNSGTSYEGKHFKLTTDICLNDETFSFNSDTGLVKMTDGTNTAYIGTGVKGDTSGANSVFDTTASTIGNIYTSEEDNTEGTYSGTVNEWIGIGTSNNYFKGIFDGDNHTVTGMYNNAEGYEGLFGRILSATVKNISVKNSFVCGTSQDVGCVVRMAYSASNIENCHSYKSIVCGSNYNVGGVVGYANGGSNIENCYNCNGFVLGNSYYVGGVIGYVSDVNVKNCYNYNGFVCGSRYVGGIVGEVFVNTTVENCYNWNSIVCGDTYIGGVVGYSNGDTKNCYNYSGVVRGNNINVGGVVGYVNGAGITKNCCNYNGFVSGGNYVGGVVGCAGYVVTIENCYNSGKVVGTAYREGSGVNTECYKYMSNGVGGIVGKIYAGSKSNTISKCVNVGEVSAYKYNAGGIVGCIHNDSSANTIPGKLVITNCYNSGDVSTQYYAGGIVGCVYSNNGRAVASFESCYNVGVIKGDTSGGFVGVKTEDTDSIDTTSVSFANCYYKLGCATNGTEIYNAMNTTEDQSGVKALTEDELKKKESYTGFDFDTVWSIYPAAYYPYPILNSQIKPDSDKCEHKYIAVVTVPTCTEQGYTTHICIYCDDEYVDTYVPEKGHTDGEWTVVTEPKIGVEGLEEQCCSECGEQIATRPIEALSGYALGDVNGDNEIDKKDYALLKRYCFGTMELDEAQLLAADVNGDGEVDKKDYALLKRYCFGTAELG